MTMNNVFLGIGLWLMIHIVYVFSSLVFKDKWRKLFQILIGIILVIVAFKFFFN